MAHRLEIEDLTPLAIYHLLKKIISDDDDYPRRAFTPRNRQLNGTNQAVYASIRNALRHANWFDWSITARICMILKCRCWEFFTVIHRSLPSWEMTPNRLCELACHVIDGNCDTDGNVAIVSYVMRHGIKPHHFVRLFWAFQPGNEAAHKLLDLAAKRWHLHDVIEATARNKHHGVRSDRWTLVDQFLECWPN